ncbi:Serine/threonine protein kinase [Giardia duodenalis]|uniref:non-specific serine/threonine protein kinase n=2 Tax=Giardia intestinalis TaxID=5741 RepID=C6LQ87_GIAIB|nr:TP53 regulating kinase [Giardia intestinalis ATCC 50581]ESU42518.1 Serine/threonine protein kinase [Giardia intestinalis]
MIEPEATAVRQRLSGSSDFKVALDNCSLMFQGAEARVYSGTLPTTGEDAVAKHRFPKGYKHPVLDAQTRQRRTRAEARALEAARTAGLAVPRVLYVDEVNACIYMSRIHDPSVSKHLADSTDLLFDEAFAELVGSTIAKLHMARIVHNDLTTSNLLYNKNERKLSIIDFGLASRSPITLETMAVDLYVLQRSILALCGPCPFFEAVLKSYVRCMDMDSVDKRQGQKILTQLEQVQGRGRKK